MGMRLFVLTMPLDRQCCERFGRAFAMPAGLLQRRNSDLWTRESTVRCLYGERQKENRAT